MENQVSIFNELNELLKREKILGKELAENEFDTNLPNLRAKILQVVVSPRCVGFSVGFSEAGLFVTKLTDNEKDIPEGSGNVAVFGFEAARDNSDEFYNAYTSKLCQCLSEFLGIEEFFLGQSYIFYKDSWGNKI